MASSSRRNNKTTNTNPFDNNDTTTTATIPTSPSNNNNPFDFDSGFEKVPSQEAPILFGIDATDNDYNYGMDDGAVVENTAAYQPPPQSSSSKHTSTTTSGATSTTTTTPAFGGMTHAMEWLRGGGGGGRDAHGHGGHVALVDDPHMDDDDDEITLALAQQKKVVKEWPYDYYHLQQEAYYKRLDQEQAVAAAQAKRKGSSPDKSSLQAQTATSPQAAQSTQPQELCDIPTAVQGLSLVDFESKAEERAIAIISTWIYEEGLLDELLLGSSGGTTTTTTIDNSDVSSVPSQQGIEVSHRGHVLGDGGGGKMDMEVSKLRNSTIRELGQINARLNDGVSASGSEVQELVHAVNACKGNLQQLRQLCSYIFTTTSEHGDGNVVGSNGFSNRTTTALLQPYPHLRNAIHARANLAKCFRELDFFTQIFDTCERLRQDMHSSEWTDQEWTVLRDVCREHVELEVFLVETEAGMKAKIDEEQQQQQQRGVGARGKGGVSTAKNYASVDRFLEEHVKIVWELGDEIKLRVLSGVGMTFDLALNNPAGMVALVEAVELYEQAAGEEYKRIYNNAHNGKYDETANKGDRLHFTDMRRGALEHIAKDFEVRGLEVFQEVQQMAADSADEDMATANFNAVLRASNDLTNQMDFVTHQMAPCFPKYWALEALWTSVVADVCSQQILGQIGGRDAHRLPDLTVTQLLDLVAWIESFREKIEDAFPDIVVGKVTNAPKPSIESGASLLHGEAKEIDVVRAKESVEWVSGVLWEVHRLAQDEFLVRTRAQTEEWLENVYSAEHAKTQNADGLLTTSLCEDVYSLVGVQLRTIRERLTKRSEVLVLAVNVIFSYLRMKQLECRDDFLTDLECCCAAANDFIRMSDQCEEILADLENASSLSKESLDTLAAQSNELLTLYSSDAVYSAQRVYVYIFEPIEEEIGSALFNAEWEETLTHNELALTLVRTLEDYMGDLEIWLEELMVRKVVDALIIATINFYIKCLLLKADNKNAKESSFLDPKAAIVRIQGDIAVIREYFESLIDVFPALGRVIGKEFEVLDTIVELMLIAGGFSDANMEEQVFVLQRKIKDINLVRFMVGDLWHLVNPGEERSIYEQLEEHEATLNAMAPEGQDAVDARNTDTGLRLDQVILKTVGESNRKRPIKGNAAVAGMENLMSKLKVGAGGGGGSGGGGQQ